MRAVAILETMWDWRGTTSGAGYKEAARYFRINPQNFSGKRLYSLVGPSAQLIVTNACRMLGTSANSHGKGDAQWLGENLRTIESFARPIETLLVCGRIAQDTLRKSDYFPPFCRVVFMPHPAMRLWTREALAEAADVTQNRQGDWLIHFDKRTAKFMCVSTTFQGKSNTADCIRL